ncbi:POTRA domain-containing protein, partial [Aegicerativicinus sediminis]
MGRHLILLLLLAFVGVTSKLQAQSMDFENGQTYTIEDISVTGETSFNPNTIVAYSGLRKGDKVKIPGEEIANAIKKLWGSNLFSSIDIYLLRTDGDKAYIEISLTDLPELNEVTIEGAKKSKIEEITKENNLKKGVKVTENLITTTKNYLTTKYQKQGYYNTKVSIDTREVQDSIEKSRVNMLVFIDKGNKVKVQDINFIGNEKLSDKKLRKAMKNTKQKNPIRVWKRSKYIEKDYKEDLVSLID